MEMLLKRGSKLSERSESQNQYNALHISIIYNHLPVVKFLIEKGIDVNETCKGKQTSLHLAAKEGNIEIINLILKNGGKKKAIDENGKMPYQIAEENKKKDAYPLLVPTESDDEDPIFNQSVASKQTDATYDLDDDFFAPTYEREQIKFDTTKDYTRAFTCIELNQEIKLKKIIEENEEVLKYFEISSGNSLLHAAVLRENTQIIRMLLSYGADINARNVKTGQTPFHLAVMKGQAMKSLLINQGADDQINDYTGENPAQMQLRYFNKDMENFNKLMELLIIGTWKETEDFIKSNVKVLNQRRKDGKKMLHIGAIFDNIKLVKLCLENGIRINSRDKEGNTALHYAAYYQNEEIAVYLMKKGAAGNFLNLKGMAPIHIAASRGYRILLESMIQKVGVDLESIDKETLLFFAIKNHLYEIAKILLLRNANPNHISGKDESPLQVVVSLDVDDTTKKLFIKLLLKMKADINLLNGKGQSPIFDCCFNGTPNVLKYMISKGATVNISDKNGNIPLHIAAQKDNTEICGVLLKSGANAAVRNASENLLPSEVAQNLKNNLVAKLLKIYETK
ncbi:hypothetical protein TVAG_252670 [Trichomonas vaginalis G3]|uniref:Uncharacterized protein n=1 Tax=Trichomonas vaginalis (strain ATCC PRA-98 / G3) TaxID=412133 RepID=A2DW09_TRIV3|nr:spectrin binding [Trichomonas vaginalis G3]EAY15454.1 hypothetical protein TVAG_252670 [Trichomonas vaginalis G3]KAI5499561.1 spectrin binding [Trichomonas vaginalis G3]|eukprot:XP_001327677.1 hypothetical protein [Trichomonas vaginalis G3]